MSNAISDNPDILPTITEKTVEWDGRAGAYLVRLEGDGGWVQQTWIAHRTGIVKRSELRENGERRLDLAFADVRTVGGHLLPHELAVKMPKGSVMTA